MPNEGKQLGPDPYEAPKKEPVAPTALGHQEKKPKPQPKEHKVGKRTVGSERAYRVLSYSFALLRGIIIIVILGILFNLFIATVFRISGESMYPSFVDGQFILVDRITYQFTEPTRGDVVILQFPGDPENRKFIKRVVGLPGETIEIQHFKEDANTVISQVLIDGVELDEDYLPAFTFSNPEVNQVIRPDEVFVMGDNRPNSNDSRFFGPVPQHNLIGVSRAVLSGSAFGFIAQPAF